MSKIKQVLIVLPICFLLGGLAVLLFLLDPTFIPDLYRITSLIIVVFWAFFIVPALLFIVKRAIKYFEDKSGEQAFLIGGRIGVIFGFGGLIILCLLFSPLMGTVWFVQSIKEANLSEKKQEKLNESDIFDV